MRAAILAAFEDELIKIAAATPAMAPMPQRRPAAMGLGHISQDVPNVKAPTAGGGKPPPPVPDRTGVVAAPKPHADISKTYQRPASAAAPHPGVAAPHMAPHAPTSLPHMGAPGGMGKAISRGAGAMLKAHGRKAALGVGLMGADVLAHKFLGGRHDASPG